ncbi:MAG TPA: endonuclease III [Sumerlaeia bacterium]|nr:endonuclease III [Sumerlaeia bacterium]
MTKARQSDFRIDEVASILRREVRRWKVPIVTEIARRKRDPFRVLIGTVLSLRTKDDCTAAAAERLFRLAQTPSDMLGLDAGTIAETIYPVGFYNTKADNILAICRDLVDRFGGQPPDSIEELVTLKGVGRKTANLVMTRGYGKRAICVDTHVHRITNRWGYVSTKSPNETEMALREILPKRYWIPINDWLVTYGQNLCAPVSPWCSRCKIRTYCGRVGVRRSR